VNSEKYIGLDVHQTTISVAVLDETGKLIMGKRGVIWGVVHRRTRPCPFTAD